MACGIVIEHVKPDRQHTLVGKTNMVWFLRNRTLPIGVDLGDDGLKAVQLGDKGQGIGLIEWASRNRPGYIKSHSVEWQRWAIDAIRQLTLSHKFRSKEVVAAIPASDVFIDHLKMPKTHSNNLDDVIFSRIKQKLPFEPNRENTLIKHILIEDDNVLVMATERKIIDRHLAIYEKAGLRIKSINVWPVALANSYARFFGRRKSDLRAIVMLVCIEPNHTNVVICRHKNLLFARSISIGARQLDSDIDHNREGGHLGPEKMVTRLVLELSGVRGQSSCIHRNSQIERLVFLCSQAMDRQLCATIAKQLEMPAQIGDCLAAVEIRGLGFDRRVWASGESTIEKNRQINWATAFGLSLS